ncbi:MAG: AMP-binding protein [Candidatus Latescibacterota bacterium]
MAQDSGRSAPESRGRHDLFPARLPADLKGYIGFHNRSMEQRDAFWLAQAGRIRWEQAPAVAVQENFAEGRVSWFGDGKLNAFRTLLEGSFEGGGAMRPAIVFLESAGKTQSFTGREVESEVRKLAAALRERGLKPGDRVALYLPDSPATVFFILACASLGLITVPIPARYTAELTREILSDSGAALLVLAFGSGSPAYEARAQSVLEAAGGISVMNAGGRAVAGTVSYAEFVFPDARGPLETFESVDAEHPLFILYANTAAGVPRGSVFATAGFLVQAAASCDYLFNPATGDGGAGSMVCTLELASAAGQCYGVWGPLLNGFCAVISAEGMRTAADRFRQALETCENPALLTTPVMLSALKRELEDAPLSDRRFRLVASSGDVLKPRHIRFAAQTLVSSPEKVLNLWVQTECGASIINTFPSTELNRPGALGLPFLGTGPLVLNYMGQVCRANESGQLVFNSSWPSMIRTIWGQDERYRQFYFRRLPGYYSTNDGARVDDQGFFWFMGRLDDVVKVRGQSFATSEIEAVLAAHPRVAEAAVVSVEGEEGKEGLAAFLVPEHPFTGNRDEEMQLLETELSESIGRRVGEYALIVQFIIAPELPRTRTGKIVRRVLKRIATGDITMDEDLSHVANPISVEKLIRERGM